jgi:segregation and condensation protein A
MEIKSKMLLPQTPESATETDDLRLELVKQLVEYRRFKDAAALLESRAEEQSSRLPREAPPEPEQPDAPPPLRPVELWDLVSAFGRLLRESAALQPTPIIVDETPQAVYQSQIRIKLRREPRVLFRELFQPPFNRSRLVGLFLAILELIKMRQIRVEQESLFGEIWVSLCEEAPDEPEAAEPTAG